MSTRLAKAPTDTCKHCGNRRAEADGRASMRPYGTKKELMQVHMHPSDRCRDHTDDSFSCAKSSLPLGQTANRNCPTSGLRKPRSQRRLPGSFCSQCSTCRSIHICAGVWMTGNHTRSRSSSAMSGPGRTAAADSLAGCSCAILAAAFRFCIVRPARRTGRFPRFASHIGFIRLNRSLEQSG